MGSRRIHPTVAQGQRQLHFEGAGKVESYRVGYACFSHKENIPP